MQYEIITFIGDYPLENQPNWEIAFDDKNEAINAARLQHMHMRNQRLPDKDNIYTIVQEKKIGQTDVEWIIHGTDELTGEKATVLADSLSEEPGKEDL